MPTKRGRPKLNIEHLHASVTSGTIERLKKHYPNLTVSQVVRTILTQHLDRVAVERDTFSQSMADSISQILAGVDLEKEIP